MSRQGPRKMADKEVPEKAAKQASPSGPTLRPDIVIERINQLTGQIVGQAEALRNQVQDSEIQRSLKELRDASTLFQAMSDNATAGIMAQGDVALGARVLTATAAAPLSQTAIAKPGCGCGGGCGDECKPKCCIELYISGLRIIDGQFGDGKLELACAVQAGDTWGLVPGLNGYLKMPVNTGGMKLNSSIAKFCVPCGECMTIPLHAEAAEYEEGAAGRMESGSARKSITIRCGCEIAPVGIAIGMTKNNEIRGVVEIEVSARSLQGGCC
jgi:hypothetical protein